MSWLWLILPWINAIVGLALLLIPAQGFWFRAALALFVWGMAARVWTAGARNTASRGALAKGIRAAAVLYILAGALAIVAAFRYLQLVPAIFLMWLSGLWIVFWAWTLAKLRDRQSRVQ